MGRRGTFLRQVLNERQVNMIAFSASIGFGLFLHTGKVINLAGPGLAVIAFCLASSIMWCVVSCLGEMTALFPVQGPLFAFPARYIDDAVGYAVGWLSWLGWAVLISNETLAISQLWRFRFKEEYLRLIGYPDERLGWDTEGYSPAVWVFMVLVLIGLTNMLPVLQYGQLEYIFGVIKMLFISGLIVFNVVLSARHHGDRFWTWNQPYGFATRNLTVHPTPVPGEGVVFTGDAGHFLSLWTATVVCFFAYIGFETIALTAAENKDLETYETIKMGSRKLTMRISILYIICTFTASLNVPYDDPMLMDIRLSSTLGSQHSIFVIMAVRNHLRGWPSFFTGFFIFSATTSAINAVYNSARLLHALASIPEAWPLPLQKLRKRLEQTTARGVPLGAIAVSWSFGLLAFLALKPFPSVVHGRIVQFVTVCGLISYGSICLAFTQFYKRIEMASKDPTLDNRSAFNREHEQYPYRTRGQSLRAWYGLIFCALLVIFNDWTVFIRPFNSGEFVAAYIAPFALLAIVAAYHVRSDGWNPLKWRRNASMQIMRPPPKVVVPGRRRGRLELPNPKEPLWEKQNLQAMVAWVWVWLK